MKARHTLRTLDDCVLEGDQGAMISTVGKYVSNRALSRVSSWCDATAAWAPM
jgi:hypothetical protein